MQWFLFIFMLFYLLPIIMAPIVPKTISKISVAISAYKPPTSGGGTTPTVTDVQIQDLSPIDFGTAVAGDPEKIVGPGTTENPENGSFLLTGAPNQIVFLGLPDLSEMRIVSGSGKTQGRERIDVYTFISFPPTNQSLTLNNNGELYVYVGATRGIISTLQDPGSYSGTYTLTVVYQ